MHDSIGSLYEVFPDSQKPDDFPICECCWSDQQKRLLLKRDRRGLTADELSEYAASVFLTVGSPGDFKYFLPRILELSLNDEFVWPDLEVALGKLRLADWYEWPESERAAVLYVLEEKFASLLQEEESYGPTIDEWICALGGCVSDITPYLDQLLKSEAKSHFLSFVEWNYEDWREGRLTNPFWSDAPDNQQRVLEWLNKAEVKRLLSEEYGMVFRDIS